MTKTEVIAAIKGDCDKAKAKINQFSSGHSAGDFSNQMYYEGQLFGLEMALMTLEYLDET